MYFFITENKKHIPAIVLSFMVGLLMVAPQLFFIASLGESYQGIYMMASDAEMHYLARMQESYDGNGSGNPFIYEYKNNVPTSLYTFSEAILAFPGKVLGVSVPTLSLFYKFFLPVIISLLVYALLFRQTANRGWALVGTTVVVLGHWLLSLPDLVNIFTSKLAYGAFALYARPVNPEFSSIIFFSYLHVFLTAIEHKKSKWFVFLGVLLGFSFYVYFYTFTFLLAFNGIYFIMSLGLKKTEVALKILAATVVGIVIGMPAIIAILALIHHPYYPDLVAVGDLVKSHALVFSRAGMVVIGLFLWYFFIHRKNTQAYFILALLLTTVVVVNQQVITGLALQEGHYHWYFNTPIFVVTLCWLGWNIFKDKSKKIFVPLGLVVAGLSIYATVFVQYSSYEHSYYAFAREQRYVPVLSWLENNTAKESVVLANPEFSALIPVFTSNNVVWEDHAMYYLLPKERRAYTVEQVLGSPDLEKELTKYRVDYVVWDTINNPTWEMSKYESLKLVATYDGIIIFAL